MSNKLALIALVVAVIALGGYFAPASVREIIREQVPGLGASPGNEIQGPDFAVNGVRTWHRKAGMSTGTTSVCALASPPATSTLIAAYATFGASGYPTTTQASATFRIYKATTSPDNGISTSTAASNPNAGLLAGIFLAPGPITVGVTSSLATSTTIAPSSFIVFDIQGASTPFFGSGTCDAVFGEN